MEKEDLIEIYKNETIDVIYKKEKGTIKSLMEIKGSKEGIMTALTSIWEKLLKEELLDDEDFNYIIEIVKEGE